MLADFEQPMDSIHRRVPLRPKRVTEDAVSDRTHRADSAAIGISLARAFEDVSNVHQLPAKLSIKPFS
jgi:hypothetical protein